MALSTHGALPRGGDPEAEASLHTGSWAAPLSDPALMVFALLCSPVLGHVPLAALPLPAPCPRGAVTYCVAPELPPAAQQVGHGLL